MSELNDDILRQQAMWAEIEKQKQQRDKEKLERMMKESQRLLEKYNAQIRIQVEGKKIET